jgi:hypothetical protein
LIPGIRNLRRENVQPVVTEGLDMRLVWQTLRAGELMCSDLPNELDLSTIQFEMDRLWKATIRDRKEAGACLVLDFNDNLKLTHDAKEREINSVFPLHHMDCCEEDCIGFFHTHVLLPNSRGEQVGFSAGDFVVVLEDGYPLAVVRSGSQVFAIVRTERTKPRAPVNQETEDLLKGFYQGYADRDLPQEEIFRRANRDICRLFGFALYVGKSGGLLRLEVIP